MGEMDRITISDILTEYAMVGMTMEAGDITEQEAFARWGRFEDKCLTGLIAGKADEKTLTEARRQLAIGRAAIAADAARIRVESGKSNEDLLVEDVRMGRANLDNVLARLSFYQEVDLRAQVGKTPSPGLVQAVRSRDAALIERLRAAAEEFKASGSRFVKDDRKARMEGAGAPQKGKLVLG